MFIALGLKKGTKVIGLALAQLFFQTDVEIWAAHVAIIFWNFVFQYDVVTKGVPSEVGQNAMVLMTIVTVMSENQIRLDLFLQPFEELLDGLALGREKSVSKILDHHLLLGGAPQESLRTRPCLTPTCGDGAEDDPSHIQAGLVSKQLQDSASAADFDIIGVRPKTEHRSQFSKIHRQHMT